MELELKDLLWDSFNSEHIGKHKVTRLEVEEACQNQLLVLTTYQGRKMFFGKTSTGRCLTIILSPAGEVGVYYVVTARNTSKKERRLLNEKDK